ncbi:MAG: tetratricopeptide repeat protein [Pseudomonadota bacterium]
MSPALPEFLRPSWLWLLLALPLLVLLARRAGRAAGAWRDAVDPHLLPHLLQQGGGRRAHRTWPWLAAGVAWVLAVLALAGPSWREATQPLWQSRLPTVIAADLSSASLAADLPPSRLARMRAALARRLEQHPGGPLALVVFAGDAFTVAPLTEDVANIGLYLDALQPDVMPVDGQAADRAIAWSRELMRRGGHARGHIVLLTDHADAAAQRAAAAARAAGYTVSAVGIGSSGGAAVTTLTGAPARVALDERSLRALARAGGGRYARLGEDDAAAFDPPGAAPARGDGEGARMPQDQGYWLLPPLMLLALLAWLRAPRAMAAVLVVVLLAPPLPGHAAEIWRRADQKAHADLLRGVEAYRRGDYDRAAELFARGSDATSHYNRGNALARDGRLQDAVAAYDEALRRDPRMADARANRAAVMAAMQRQGVGKGDPSSQRRGGASDRGDQRSSRNARSEGEGAARGGQGRPAKPAPDPEARADAAQRQRMQDALQRSRAQQAAGAQQAARDPQSARQRERRLSNDAALRRIPDEPGSLLREKFRLEYERRRREGGPG